MSCPDEFAVSTVTSPRYLATARISNGNVFALQQPAGQLDPRPVDPPLPG